MKQLTTLFAFMVSVILLTSCGSARGTINDLQDLNYDLKYNSERFTAEDWRDAKGRLDKIQKNVKKYDFTDEQLKEIGALTASCYVYMGKNTLRSTFKDIRDAVIQAQGAADEIKAIIEDVKRNRRDK